MKTLEKEVFLGSLPQINQSILIKRYIRSLRKNALNAVQMEYLG